MKKTKMWSIISASALVLTVGATSVLAASPNMRIWERSDLTKEQQSETKQNLRLERKLMINGEEFNLDSLTEEQKAELEAKRAEMAEKMADGSGRFQMREEFNLDSLTEEEKAELEAKRAEMEEKMKEAREKAEAIRAKYDALTDEQKAELSASREAECRARMATIDKYLELGLIDEEAAAKMKASIEERIEQMSSEDCGFFGMGMEGRGNMPMGGAGKMENAKGGMMGGKGLMRGRGMARPSESSNAEGAL